MAPEFANILLLIVFLLVAWVTYEILDWISYG